MSLSYDNERMQAAARERAEVMLRMLERGDTMQEVARVWGVSRQRVHALMARHFPDRSWPRKGMRGRRPGSTYVRGVSSDT